MPRPRTLGLAAAILLVLLVIGLLVALPEIVRRVAVDQLGQRTGRAVSLERVELNLFTGRVALHRFRLAQRGSSDPALEVEALEFRVALTSLLGSHLRVPSLTLTGPRLHVARLTETTFDFSDLLALIPPADPQAKPSTRTVSVERIVLTRGALVARDDVTQTAWTIDDLAVDGTGLGTGAGPAGKLAVRLKLNGTPVVFDAAAVDVAKGVVLAKLTVDGFELAQVRPFIPAAVGAAPTAGRASVSLDLKVERASPTARVAVAGDARVDGLTMQLATAAAPFATIGKIAVSIKDAQPLARIIALESVTIDGVDAKLTRDKNGRIDLLALASGAPPAVPAPAVATPSTTDATLKVSVREIALRNARVTLRDEAVGATLALTDLAATVRDAAWPASAPLTFEVATGLPTAGKLSVKGSATLAPIVVDLAMSMRGAPIEPYQPYIPIPGRFAGTFNGESQSRVAIADGKLTMAVSHGKSWIDGLALRAPGVAASTAPPVQVARVMIDGIHFTHPGKAAAKTITITRPEIRVERDAAGEINLRKLFAAETPELTTSRKPVTTAALPPPPPSTPTPAASPTVSPTAVASTEDGALVLRTPMPVELGAFVIEDGYARFLDRTTQPAFSETVSKLAIRIDGLSSEPGRRAQLAVQAIVGGDSALDLKGEIAPFGGLYANVAGELRGFVLPTVNPYADTAIAWVIERGTLGVKLHYVIEKNQLTAKNEIIVDNLRVARSKAEDEVQRRIGLPLGLIVALVTDSNNGIRVNLPLTGSLQTWSADVSDAIWAAVKNVVVNVIASPFRAIGRMFKGTGDTIESLAIDPAPFAPGSPTLAAEAERHLAKVADFLRKSPAIKLTLAPVTVPADGESLREQALNGRLQKVQRDEKLETFDAAVAKEFARVFPGEPAPKTVEERLARLREREPVPTEAVAQLATRRLTVVRDALAEKEGIPPVRLVTGEVAAATSGDGRVEFKIGQ